MRAVGRRMGSNPSLLLFHYNSSIAQMKNIITSENENFENNSYLQRRNTAPKG
jgi:hypothetical protein